MKMTFFAVLFVAGSCACANGQIPGDGIPDLYLFWSPAITTVQTSVGPVSRPFGTMLLDTDGTDTIAILIEGPDITNSPDNGNFLTGSTAFLPDPNAAPPLFSSSWTSGYIAGSSQFIRTNPLDTDGFVGVIGEYDDPFGIYPLLGLAHYDGCPQDFGDVIIATDSGTVFSTENGTMAGVGPILLGGPPCVPEPTSLVLVLWPFIVASMARGRGMIH